MSETPEYPDERQYKVVVYEVIEGTACELPQCPLGTPHPSTEILSASRELTAPTPWDAVRKWADEMEAYESQ